MARYYQSWKSNLKSTFAPLPVEYMAQKIQGKQGERDTVEQMLQGDYNPLYNTNMVNGDYVSQRRANYQNELDNLRGSLDTMDFTAVLNNISQIRSKYNQTDGTGVSYSSSSSSSGKSGSNKYDASGDWAFNTLEDNMEYNYYGAEKAREAYDKMNDANAQAYQYYYIDKLENNIYNQTGGDPTKQGRVDFKVVNPYINETDFISKTITMTNGWRSDKKSWVNWTTGTGGQYMNTASNEYVKGDEVFRSVYGYIISNDDWNNHQDVMYTYGVEKVGNISQDYYANEYLNRMAEGDLSTTIKGWDNLSNDQKMQMINDKKQEILQGDLNRGYSQDDLMFHYGLQQFKHDKALTIANFAAEKQAFNKYDVTSPKANLQGEYGLAKKKYDLDNATSVTNVTYAIQGFTPKQKAENVVRLFTNLDIAKNAATDAQTTTNNKKDDLIQGMFGVKFDPFNPIQSIQDIYNANQKFDNLVDSGLVQQLDNGHYDIKPDNYDQIRQSIGSDFSDVQIKNWISDHNTAVDEMYRAQRNYNDQQFITSQMRDQWSKTGELNDYVDNLFSYTRQNTIPVEVDGVKQDVTKEQLTQYILEGKDINRYVSTGIGGYSKESITSDIVDKISDWAADSDIGDYFITRFGFSNRDSHVFDGVKANENAFKNDLVFQQMVDAIDGNTFQSKFKNIDFKKDYTVKDVNTTIISTPDGPMTEISYTLQGVDGKGKPITEVQTGIVRNSTIQQNYGIDIQDAQHRALVDIANNAQGDAPIDMQSFGTNWGTLYQGIASTSKNVNHHMIFNNNSDMIYELSINGKKGDVSGVVYTDPLSDTYYVYYKVDDDAPGLQLAHYKGNNPNNLILDMQFDQVTHGKGAYQNLGELDYDVSTGGFYSDINNPVKPINQ